MQLNTHLISNKSLKSKGLTSVLLLFSFLLPALVGIPNASAQTQYIGATPNYINLGMTVSISVTAPASGTYTVVVQKPSAATTTLNYDFIYAGQVQTEIFGNATSGFKAVVDEAGTYNIFLLQGSTLVSSNSFLATNKILISFNMLEAGLCVFVPGGTRGEPMLAQFHVTYASNGATVENFNHTAANVTYTLPDGTVASARLHKNSSTTWLNPWYQGHVWPSWNSSWVGDYYPSVNASDQYGNVGTFKYSGYPFPITPATLSTSIQIRNANTDEIVTGLYNGQVDNITANIQYLQGVDPVPGFNGPLDATRGGAVTVMVGWGPYNATSASFGNSETPGGLVATVPMTYSNSAKVWTGVLKVGVLSNLVNASAYEVVVSSHDKASPPNTGFATLDIPTATLKLSANTNASTSTTTSVSTSFIVAVTTSTKNDPTVTPLAYVIMALLLIIGIFAGYVSRRKPES